MPEFAKPVPGNFCWTEIFVDDPARARGFYGELFGWGSQEMPTPQGPYNMFQIGGKMVAGATKMPAELKKTGAPPHWLNHVFVTDANAATNQAKSLGGKVVMPPTQVGPGTMAVIQDPTGGTLALWSTTQSMGTFLWGENNALCWNELMTSDVDAALKFYSGLFGWKVEPMPMGDFTYNVMKNGDTGIAGVMAKPKEKAQAPTFWLTYFAVADCDATAKKTEKLGGKIWQPPTDIPDVGRFAILSDPAGAAFAILKPLPRS